MTPKTALTHTAVRARDSRPARVLLLESGTGPGGSVNFLRDFAVHVDRRKLSLIVGLYSPNPSRSLSEMDRLGVPVVVFGAAWPSEEPAAGRISRLFDTRLRRIRPLRTVARLASRALTLQLPLAWKLRSFIKREAVELIVLNQDVHFHLPGALAAKWAGVPCICRKAGGIGEGRRLKRLLNRWVDLFVSISQATDADQRSTPGTRRLINLYEGVDLTRFNSLPANQAMRKQLGLPDGKKIVASVSRIEKGKGQIEFIKMVPVVLNRYRDAAFLIVGGGEPGNQPLMTELKALARALDVENDIVFAGWRDDIPAVMTAIDVFVHCPTTFIEGMGMTCLEAMASSVPAVISDNGGLPDAVVDGVTAFVVPRGDVDRMAGAVVSLLADEGLAREFGRQARRRVEQVFDMATNGHALQEILLQYAHPARHMPDEGIREAGPAGGHA
jgi:glycosyltransferase involved in cell wall biosynthesis